MFPVRYELNSYINLLRNSVFKGITINRIIKKFVLAFRYKRYMFMTKM
jgi:hypothetical protein